MKQSGKRSYIFYYLGFSEVSCEKGGTYFTNISYELNLQNYCRIYFKLVIIKNCKYEGKKIVFAPNTQTWSMDAAV